MSTNGAVMHQSAITVKFHCNFRRRTLSVVRGFSLLSEIVVKFHNSDNVAKARNMPVRNFYKIAAS